jgi:hypothetical protein
MRHIVLLVLMVALMSVVVAGLHWAFCVCLPHHFRAGALRTHLSQPAYL